MKIFLAARRKIAGIEFSPPLRSERHCAISRFFGTAAGKIGSLCSTSELISASLNLVMIGQQIVVTKNGREVGRFIPKDVTISYLTDSLTGILKGNYDLNKEKSERLMEKYGSVD